jgi:hypothetical protein
MKQILRYLLGMAILGAMVAAGIILVGKKPEPTPLPTFYNRAAVKKTKARLSQAAVDKVIAPLSEDLQAKVREQYPDAGQWIDKFRALYAALSPGAKEEIAKNGKYSFKIGDLPKPQADVLREWLKKDDRTRADLEAHTGKPLDLSEVTFSFVVGGGLVQLRYGAEGFDAGWGPIGKAPESKKAAPDASRH